MDNDETDLIYGLEAIAAHLKLRKKQVSQMHDRGHLPTFKIGGRVCARRSTLAKHFAAQERAALEAKSSRGDER